MREFYGMYAEGSTEDIDFKRKRGLKFDVKYGMLGIDIETLTLPLG